MERQLTTALTGHILTHANVWSPDGRWIVYDVRSDPAGSVFDGTRIERVHVESGRIEVLYHSTHGASCGVASYSPVDERVAFILGPEHPTTDWNYSACHRRGVIVETDRAGIAINMDGCDLVPPFTSGALRGGSHLHLFDRAGEWISFTYEDAVLGEFNEETPQNQINLRGIGVCVPGEFIAVSNLSDRNYNGNYFSALVTRLTAIPSPGSDEIRRASEEGWVGDSGYVKGDGTQQRRAIAFQGQVVAIGHKTITELFIVDLPDDVMLPGDGPLQGTATHRPYPPAGCTQRRLTYTTDRRYPGLTGPRHWADSSPDGSHIAFLMKDDAGIVQLHLISPSGGAIRQLTRNPWSVASAFTWNVEGGHIACIIDNSVFVTDIQSGESRRLTPRVADEIAPRPEACVFSPDGEAIAYVRPSPSGADGLNQIYIVTLEK